MKVPRVTTGIATTALALTFAHPAAADPVSTQDDWTRVFEVENGTPTLDIRNVWGDVIVRPGDADRITVKARERRSAPTRALYDRSLEVLRLQVETTGNGVSLRVGGNDERWYREDPCRGCRAEFRFEVTAPPGTTLTLSTVNDGRVEVSGMAGSVNAGNVNGPVRVTGARDCDEISSVNGDLDVSFLSAPGEDCALETVNGDIEIRLPADAGMNVAFDLFNGRFRTDFTVGEWALPPTVEHEIRDGRHVYRIEQPAGVRLAGGGPHFNISSLNGDVRILKTP